MIGVIKALGALLSPITTLWRVAVGDRAQLQQEISAEQLAAHSAYMAEWQATRGGFVNAVVDAINRLVRPAMTFGVVFVVFVAPWIDPERFAVYAQALALVPDPLWSIMWTVAAFWFGSRVVEKVVGTAYQAPSLEKAAKVAHMARMLDRRDAEASSESGNWATRELRRLLGRDGGER